MSAVNGVSSIQATMARIQEISRMGQPSTVAFADVLATAGTSGISTALQSFGVRTGSATGAMADALSWGRTQIGTPYAAVNPFRFGDVPWDGRAHLSVNGNGKTYQFPAGTRVYDCSGFATSVWRRAGVDLAEWGATTSQTMLSKIPRVDPSQAVPGDLVVKDTDGDGVADHVLVLDEGGYSLEATGPGVVRREMSWENVLGVVRPSLLVSGAAAQA